MRKSSDQLYSQCQTASRAGGGPITAARWAFLQEQLGTIQRFPVYMAVEDETAIGIITNKIALHRGSLLEGVTQILLGHLVVNTVDIRTYPSEPLVLAGT